MPGIQLWVRFLTKAEIEIMEDRWRNGEPKTMILSRMTEGISELCAALKCSESFVNTQTAEKKVNSDEEGHGQHRQVSAAPD
jgi:hypothetical protein